MKRRDFEDDLKNIPSVSLSEEDVGEHRYAPDRFAAYDSDDEADTPTQTLSLWATLLAVVLMLLVAGYFILDLRSELNSNKTQLQTAITQLEELSSNNKQVSNTGSTLQDQLKTTKSDIKKLQDDLAKVQQDNKTILNQQAQLSAKLDDNKKTVTALQESLSKNGNDVAEKQAAQLKALEAKVNDLSVDVMAKQEQGTGSAITDGQRLTQIEEQLKSIDTYRQTVNTSITKMQEDINKLYIDVGGSR
jgi:chromosome segregation ATPase